MCHGTPSTIVGTAGADVLDGTPGPDVIAGLGGDDTINGKGGKDIVCAGSGDDIVNGGSGPDRIYGDVGDDVLGGGVGPDRLFGQAGDDTLTGDAGSDSVNGGPGTDDCTAETETQCEAPPPAHHSFGNGTWRVGTDFPAGRYRMISNGTSCYWERLSGFSGEFEDIIANDFGYDTQIVDIASGDRGFKSSACDLWSDNLSSRRPSPRAPLTSDGDYLVGAEMAAGTWRSSGPAGGEFCYWERLSGFSGEFDDIIANDFTDAPSIVTVQSSDVGFYADPDCGTWTRQ